MEGIVLFNKPKGKTSYEIVEFFKQLTKKKVGHGGTLDPFAEGLLILGIGKYTRELQKFLKESSKVYIAEIELGKVSSTYDSEGEIRTRIQAEREEDLHKLFSDIKQVEEVLSSFIGEIYQKPPPFSAIKIRGKPAYEFARKGKSIDLPERKVKIYDLKILEYLPPILKIEALVGSGVYLRSLANDLGEKLGYGGYLKNLIRTKINEFSLEEALDFEDLEKDYLEFQARVYGIVQGVGFRFFVEKYAKKFNLKGYVKNLPDGTVKVLVQGKEKNLQELIENLKKGPILAKVEKLEIVFRKPKHIYSNFQIIYN